MNLAEWVNCSRTLITEFLRDTDYKSEDFVIRIMEDYFSFGNDTYIVEITFVPTQNRTSFKIPIPTTEKGLFDAFKEIKLKLLEVAEKENKNVGLEND